jgi:uncharacterized MAPEG superfamily protein
MIVMMNTAQILVWSAILTFVMVITASYYRNRAWNLEGLRRSMGNRDDPPPATPISGRADRAAMNMLENLVFFTALAAALNFSGRNSAQAELGANIFFWARIAYFPTYLAGIAYLRPVIWFGGVIGLGMMAIAVL